MLKARKYVVKNHFKGTPKRSDFDLVEYELSPLQDGEILVKTEWISVDPYQRAYNANLTVPYDQYGYQVAVVEESRNVDYPVGIRVVSHKGWCDYSVLTPSPKYQGSLAGASSFFESKEDKKEHPANKVYKLPDLKGLSTSHGIGAIGMPGATAYFGFLEVCQPKEGETVVVTGAAGAVGSLVGQIAKIKGCRVIGFAGSDDKVRWLEKELGFDRAFNYKSVDVAAALREAAPQGVDCYFDNVGGEISSTIMYQMNEFGRISVCGSISTYHEDPRERSKSTTLQPAIVFKQLRHEGFVVWRWIDRWPEAFERIKDWIERGELKPAEHVVEGFDKLFDAFVGMLAGDNYGKAVVKV